MKQSVAGIALRAQAVLLTQRKPGGIIGGRWEFPGGKIDDAETPQDALERELCEELGVDCSVGEEVAQAAFDNGPEHYLLRAYEVQLGSERFVLREHTATRWVPWSEIAEYDLPQSDRALLGQLLARFSPA